jgi:hypothetical protein
MHALGAAHDTALSVTLLASAGACGELLDQLGPPLQLSLRALFAPALLSLNPTAMQDSADGQETLSRIAFAALGSAGSSSSVHSPALHSAA